MTCKSVQVRLNEMPEASSLCWFFLGLAVGILFDLLWRRTGVSKYERRVEMLEHYHWGFALLILARILKILSATFAGMGLYLVFAELTQSHPFAIKSSHEFLSTMIGVILAIPLILAYVTL